MNKSGEVVGCFADLLGEATSTTLVSTDDPGNDSSAHGAVAQKTAMRVKNLTPRPQHG
jgi:hypothetical protein